MLEGGNCLLMPKIVTVFQICCQDWQQSFLSVGNGWVNPKPSSFTLQRYLKRMCHLLNLKVFGSSATCFGIMEMEN
jgi:hypothetical protein